MDRSWRSCYHARGTDATPGARGSRGSQGVPCTPGAPADRRTASHYPRGSRGRPGSGPSSSTEYMVPPLLVNGSTRDPVKPLRWSQRRLGQRLGLLLGDLARRGLASSSSGSCPAAAPPPIIPRDCRPHAVADAAMGHLRKGLSAALAATATTTIKNRFIVGTSLFYLFDSLTEREHHPCQSAARQRTADSLIVVSSQPILIEASC